MYTSGRNGIWQRLLLPSWLHIFLLKELNWHKQVYNIIEQDRTENNLYVIFSKFYKSFPNSASTNDLVKIN